MKKKIMREAETPNGACLFCQIASGHADARIVFEDEISVAFLDIRPLFAGHCLLITKGHYRTLGDLPAILIGPFFTNVQRLARTVQDVMKAEGTFVAMNNVISQSVPHLHVHVVPRRTGDGLRGFFWPRGKYHGAEIAEVQEALREGLQPSS